MIWPQMGIFAHCTYLHFRSEFLRKDIDARSAKDEFSQCLILPFVLCPWQSPFHKEGSIVREKIRVLLADDDDMTRVLLMHLFGDSGDIEIVGEAADGKTAVEMTSRLLPDAVIMDIGMPYMNGIDASRVIHSEYPQVQVIALSMLDEAEMGEKMKEAGAVGYFCKNEPWTDTVQGIHQVLAADLH